MKLDELFVEIAKDFPVDETDLKMEVLKTETLWAKYVKIYFLEKIMLEQRQAGRATLYSIKRLYHSGQAGAEVYKQNPPMGPFPKTDAGIDRIINIDQDVIAYDEGTIIQRAKVDALKAAM